MQTFIAAVSIALCVSFLCSIFESVLLSINHAQIESLTMRRKKASRLLREFKQKIDIPIAAILIINTIAHTVGTAVAGATYQNVFDPDTLWVFTIVFTTAVLLFTEIIPKTLGVTHANALATPVAYGIRALIVLLGPLVWLTGRISLLLRGNSKGIGTSIEEIRLLTAFARSEGVVGMRTAGMIVGATKLPDITAADVMLPRQQVVFLSSQWDRDRILETIKESGHSRFPFTRAGTIDQTSGIVLAKELLLQLQTTPGREIDWSALVREPIVVPESQPLNRLLRTFQESHFHIALVVDEYGHIEGLVTMEDILEEIVGEIIDESDTMTPGLAVRSDGSLEIKADVELHELCRYLDLPWEPTERSHTVNGLLTEKLERLPRSGDIVHWRGHRIEVVAANERRAETVRLLRSDGK